MVNPASGQTDLIVEFLSRRAEYDMSEFWERLKMKVLERRKWDDEERKKKTALQTLCDLGCDLNIVSSLGRQEDGARSAWSELRNRHYPSQSFLPVIPRGLYGLYALTAFVRNNGQGGGLGMRVDPAAISDNQNVPKLPYYCLDVDFGERTVGMNMPQALSNIRSLGRLPLTIDEVLALCTHSNVLLKRALCAAGSSCGDNDLPVMIIAETKPILEIFSKARIDISEIPIGIPSCARRYVDPAKGWLVYEESR